MAFFDALNTREMAWLIWIAVLLAGLFFVKNIRKPTRELLKAFFQKTILTSIAITAIYAMCCVWILHAVNLWNSSMLKDTLVWFLSAPLLSLFKITTIAEDRRYFASALKDLVAFSAITEFIVSSYTFSLWAELMLALVGTFAAILLTVAEQQPKYLHLQRFFKSILLLIGGSMIIYSLVNITIHLIQFASWQTLNSFLLTPLLTLLYLPFIYLLLAYMEYDTAFKMLPRAIQNKSLLHKAKKMALLHFGLKWRVVRRWRVSVSKHPPATMEELKRTFTEIRELRKQEKHPPIIETAQGWSPYIAKNFLQSEGVLTGHYDRCYDDSFFSTSEYIKLNSALISPDTMIYSVVGTMEKVVKLSLSFANHAPFHSGQTDLMVRYAKSLFLKAAQSKIPVDIETAIKERRYHYVDLNPLYCLVKRIDFVDSEKGYSFSVSIGVKEAHHLPMGN